MIDEKDYADRRQILIVRLLSIPRPRFFPRTVHRVLYLIAALDAEYTGEPINVCYKQLLNEYNDRTL